MITREISEELEPTIQEMHKRMVNSLHFSHEVDKTYLWKIGPNSDVAVTLNNRLERI